MNRGVAPGDTPFGAVEAVHELMEAITVAGPVDPFVDDAVRLGESESDSSPAMPADQSPVLLVDLDDVLVPGEVELLASCDPSLVTQADDVFAASPARDGVVGVVDAGAPDALGLLDAVAGPGGGSRIVEDHHSPGKPRRPREDGNSRTGRTYSNRVPGASASGTFRTAGRPSVSPRKLSQNPDECDRTAASAPITPRIL
jgi:hypothetical protein